MDFQQICLVGNDKRRLEFLERVPHLALFYQGEHLPTYEQAELADVFIDLNLDEHPERLPFYFKQEGVLIASSLKQSLRRQKGMYVGDVVPTLLGINALPTFLKRPVWEVSVTQPEDVKVWKALEKAWDIEVEVVADRIGMVTPRVIFMIINEAYIMWQEGTAEPDDIDIAMKLGTNYPKGPIAWSQEIGLENVVEVLQLLYEDTGSMRFAPCRLMKEKQPSLA
ncbi:MAG: 3-hydroxyacyl-CoA dehydrogenase family protein [Bacteroidota bacterium]